MSYMRVLGLFLLAASPWESTAQQTIKLSSTLTIEKTDDKQKTHDALAELINTAKEKKLAGNVVRFLDNSFGQVKKVLEVAEVVAQKSQETPKEFTSGKYKVKPMPKLRVKKPTIKKITAEQLRKMIKSGKPVDFDHPVLVSNVTQLFKDDDWDAVQRALNSNSLMGDADLESKFRLEYWPPDKARARLVGNMMQMEEPNMVPFSKYMVICFHGTPAKPTLPGQMTEHCEQKVNAFDMMSNATFQDKLNILSEFKNTLPLQDEFRKQLLWAGRDEFPIILGKKHKKWVDRNGRSHYRFFVFGPSGSGDKLHAENGLPFFDILVHGSRRWLLMTEQELERVAVKAREALEFDKTSAYMFFEDKLPELKEEFGLKKYVEGNQDAGDLMFVPNGWFRVSVSLADSISFYETVLSSPKLFSEVVDNSIWKPMWNQYSLAYCHKPDELDGLPGVKAQPKMAAWLQNALKQVKMDEAIPAIITVMMQCGSIMALDKPLPHLKANKLSVCTPAVWKKCRSRLAELLNEKGSTATLNWLPKQAPSSIDDIKSPTQKSDEL